MFKILVFLTPHLLFTAIPVSVFLLLLFLSSSLVISASLSFCCSFYFALSLPLVSLQLSLLISRDLILPVSPTLSLSLSVCHSLSSSPANPLLEHRCLPLFLHPSLSLVFLIRWQYIQGFCSLVFLTVTLLQDKTENKSRQKKKTLLTYLKIFPAHNESTKWERRNVCRLFTPSSLLLLPIPSPLHPKMSSKNAQMWASNTPARGINSLPCAEGFGVCI